MKSRSAFLLAFFISCDKTPSEVVITDAPSKVERLTIQNACDYDIWIQQDNIPNYDSLILMKSGESISIQIPEEGLASTRLWPKKDCDDSGNNCKVGQSSPPCPDNGCAPPVDSKLEVTWGCTLEDKSSCAKTPQGDVMYDTWWDSSAADGYTFPFTVNVLGGDSRDSCLPANCSDLRLLDCPISDDLSDDGACPEFMYEDLNVQSYLGCFSPCMKFVYPAFGGLDMNDPAGSIQKNYCCPTPPVSPEECSSGPVNTTGYVDLIHSACKNSVYGYPYDDGLGLRNCSADVELQFVIGPNCP